MKQVEREPSEEEGPAPFTTMELQQAAGRRLKLSIDATMQLAQELFEGGLITYHRTDSPALSEEALAMARAFIAQDFPAGLPDKPNVSKAKGNAQEAHEAIRPTSLEEDIPEGLAGDAAALYRLIRARFLASQCKPAVYQPPPSSSSPGIPRGEARGSVRARGVAALRR
ncbi:DNA topoisomerase [Cystobacter fuscus]